MDNIVESGLYATAAGHLWSVGTASESCSPYMLRWSGSIVDAYCKFNLWLKLYIIAIS